MEATPGIEPGFTDLQSAASPLRHVASIKHFRLSGGGLYQPEPGLSLGCWAGCLRRCLGPTRPL